MKQVVSLKDLPAFCKSVVVQFSQKQLVLLSGPLGAGKTQFVKTCVQLLHAEVPQSPTFSLINEYSGGDRSIYHVDLYRLTTAEDIESTGFWDLFRETSGLIFIEWAERIPVDSWPVSWNKINVDVSLTSDESKRIFDISGAVR